MMRFKESANGANGYVLELEAEDGAKIIQEDWFSNRSGGTTYPEKDRKTGELTGKDLDLPGMARLKSISKAITGDALAFMNTEPKIIPIYDFNKQAEVDTDVNISTDFIGKPIMVLVQRTLQDKQEADASGEYVDVAKVKATNEILAWVDPVTNKTFSETAAGKDALVYAKFIEKIEQSPINDKRVLSKSVDENTPKEEKLTEGSAEAQNAFK